MNAEFSLTTLYLNQGLIRALRLSAIHLSCYEVIERVQIPPPPPPPHIMLSISNLTSAAFY